MPAFFGLVPPTTLVPYSMAWPQWKVPCGAAKTTPAQPSCVPPRPSHRGVSFLSSVRHKESAQVRPPPRHPAHDAASHLVSGEALADDLGLLEDSLRGTNEDSRLRGPSQAEGDTLLGGLTGNGRPSEVPQRAVTPATPDLLKQVWAGRIIVAERRAMVEDMAMVNATMSSKLVVDGRASLPTSRSNRDAGVYTPANFAF